MRKELIGYEGKYVTGTGTIEKFGRLNFDGDKSVDVRNEQKLRIPITIVPRNMLIQPIKCKDNSTLITNIQLEDGTEVDHMWIPQKLSNSNIGSKIEFGGIIGVYHKKSGEVDYTCSINSIGV
jgi:hypothetical protein